MSWKDKCTAASLQQAWLTLVFSVTLTMRPFKFSCSLSWDVSSLRLTNQSVGSTAAW